MALRRTEPQWKSFLGDAGITDDTVLTTYAQSFVQNNLTELSLPGLDKDTLIELGVASIGHRLSILNLAKANTNPTAQLQTNQPTQMAKASVTAQLSRLTLEMTHPQFRKFLQDWNVYKNITHLQQPQFTAHLYNACDDAVQNSLINTFPGFLELSEVEAIAALKTTVTQRVNPELHRKEFGDILQGEKETIKNFVVRLRSAVTECSYECPSCKFDLSDTRIRDQFIRGLGNKALQTDVLAKTDQLKTLEDLIKHAESFEAAVRDQEKLQGDPSYTGSEVYGFHMKHKKPFRQQKSKPCTGCGSTSHQSNERSKKCSAWGKDCNLCGKPNHFASVCREAKSSTPSEEEVSSIDWAPDNPDNRVERVLAVQQTSTQKDSSQTDPIISPLGDDEVRATVRLGHLKSSNPCVADMNLLPDSGATICLGGTDHLDQLGLSRESLIPCNKQVRVVGGTVLKCLGYIPAAFTIGKHSTRQRLYICEGVSRIFLSRRACIDVKILPPTFPQPMDDDVDDTDFSVNAVDTVQTSENSDLVSGGDAPLRKPPPMLHVNL